MKLRNRNPGLIVVAVLMAFSSALFPMQTYAVTNIDGGELKAQFEEAAELQVIANAMRKCVTHITEQERGYSPSIVESGDVFYKSIKPTNISTGLWLEHEVQDKYDDGEIWCENNKGKILKVFANAVHADYMKEIICTPNGENSYIGGLFDAYAENGVITEHNCGGKGVKYYQAKEDEKKIEHLRSVYENYRVSSGNPYIERWEGDGTNLGDFSDSSGRARGYWIYYKDFSSFCMETPDKDTTIKVVSRDYGGGTWGKVLDKDVYVRGNWESKKFSNFIGTEKFTCKTLSERMNNYAEDYAKMLRSYLKTRCKEVLSPIIADKLREYQNILDGNAVDENGDPIEYSEEDLTAAQAYIDRWFYYGRFNGEQFVEETAEGGYICNTDAEVGVTFSAVDPERPQDVEVNCINSGGSGSLGWVVCPIMEWMGNAAVEAYTDFVEPSLRIEPKLFNQEGDSGTKQGWSIFQGVANILFIIMFLVVIFSQLTGMGIDNYGIKKILPKLIVVAILVNLSYYICLICVDLSNILGSGLRALFDGLPASVPADVTAAIGSTGTGMGLLSVGLLAAVAVGGAWMIWSNPAMLLSLLVGALGVLISILFLFVLLAGREAAVVVLTVISPLAFVCYALPNTKKLFDKWMKLGEGLLLVYPICGLMVGGGNYASRLLLAAGVASSGFVGALTAMLMGIVPIFFVPTVLKGSFAAMGSVGAKISGIGKLLGGSLQKGVRNSNGYKDLQMRGMERRTRIRAGYDKNGNKIVGKGGKPMGIFRRALRGGERNMQRSALAYQKMVSDRGSLKATEGEDFMLAVETANEMKRIVASGEINRSADLETGLRTALGSGDKAKIRAYTDALVTKGEDGRGAIRRAYDRAISAPSAATSDAARVFADNIMANHAADFKNNNRSMYEVAKTINTSTGAAATGAGATVGSYVAAHQADLAGKVTATTIGNMDDEAFKEIFGGYGVSQHAAIPAGVNAGNAAAIGAIAYAALNDQNANIKAERRGYLEDILRRSGYVPDPQRVDVTNPSLNVTGSIDANVTNPTLNVSGTVDVGNEVDVNIRQSRGGQVNPVRVVRKKNGR